MKNLVLPDIDLNKEVNKCSSMEDLVGKNGLMQRLFGDIIQQFLEAEMEEHLGRSKYSRNSDEDKNYRNGFSPKNIKTSFGEVEVGVPRDRKAEIDELYGVDISPAMISKITDKVMDTAIAWQNRPLEPIYPIVYMDALYYKVKDDHRIVNKAAYVCMSLDMKGHKDILGIWIGEQEGAKFWLSVCNDLKNRGVKDIIIACMDGLKGLPDVIKTVFPNVNIQSCIIHQIRNSIKYIASKDSKAFMKDLKTVYKAVNEEEACNSLQILGATWGEKYPIVIDSWNNNRENLSTYFDFPPEIRKIIYTNNALEGFNRQLRKFTKIRTTFPRSDSLRKELYLATEQIMAKWTSPSPNWAYTLAQLTIMFRERLEQYI